jgi:hypothetical protein
MFTYKIEDGRLHMTLITDDMEINVHIPINEIRIEGKSLKSDYLNIHCTTLNINVYDDDDGDDGDDGNSKKSLIGTIDDEDKYFRMLRQIHQFL